MRRLVFILSLALLIALVASVAYGEEKIVLNTISGPDPMGQMAKENALFEKLTGIKVNVTTVPYGREQRTKLVTAFMAGGTAYDMYVIDCVEVPEYVEAGWALDVTPWVTPEMEKDILPFAKDGMMYRDKWYGLPWVSEWKSFVYNAKKLQDAGFAEPPNTWEEFVEQCQKLQNAGLVRKYATAWSWAQKECIICDFVPLAVTFKGEFFDKDLNPLFNKGGAIEALQFMIDTIDKYEITNPASLTYTESDVDQAIYAGDIAFCFKWGLPLVPLNDPEVSKVVGECMIGLTPSVDGKSTVACSGPMGWSISPGSRDKEAAWKYIEFRAGLEGAKRNAVNYGVVPGWASLYTDPEVLETIPGLDLMLEQGKHIVNRPRVPWYYEFSAALQLELHNALTHKKTPQVAMDDAVAKALEIKAEYEE